MYTPRSRQTHTFLFAPISTTPASHSASLDGLHLAESAIRLKTKRTKLMSPTGQVKMSGPAVKNQSTATPGSSFPHRPEGKHGNGCLHGGQNIKTETLANI